MKIKHLLFAVVAMSLCAVSCNTPEEPQEPTNELKTFTVSLNLTGEIDVTENPLTRFTPDSNDLYGIQIDYKPVSGGSYQHYAYGLFDDLSDTSIELIENHYYKFSVVVIDDGKNIVAKDLYGGYDYPFKTYDGGYQFTEITNKLVVTSSTYFNDLYYNLYHTNGNRYECAPCVEKYSGSLTDYKPTAEGEQINIEMFRRVFGIKVIAGDFLTEGELKVWVCDITYNNGDDIFTLTPNKKEHSVTYGMFNSPSYLYVDFQWTKADGTVYNYESISVDINRLKETVINVGFYDDSTLDGNSVALKFEEAEITEGATYTHGDEQSDYDW